MELHRQKISTFVHIPKTGGSSIWKMYSDVFYIWDHDLRRHNYLRFPLYGDFKVENHSFTIVRNTWDRIYSAYSYLRKGGSNQRDLEDYYTYINDYADFEDFILNGLDRAALSQLHFIPQLFWIANDFKVKTDEVLRYDNFIPRLEEIVTGLGKEWKGLPIFNKSNGGDFKEQYNQEMIDKVAKLFRQEIEFFDFTI